MSDLSERAVKALQYGERKRPDLRSRRPLIIAQVAYAPRTVRKALFFLFAFFAFFAFFASLVAPLYGTPGAAGEHCQYKRRTGARFNGVSGDGIRAVNHFGSLLDSALRS